jgi:hypothetical protein
MFKTSSNESHAWLIFSPEDGAKKNLLKRWGGIINLQIGTQAMSFA